MTKIIGKLRLVTILGGILVVGFLGLVLYNVRDMLFGTPFNVTTAQDGSTITNAFEPITGTAPHAREVTINGREVTMDPEGNFADGVILSPGYNIVEVDETNQFGREKKDIYHWVAIPSTAVAQNDSTPYH